jgi:hypothetical protein
MHGTGVKINKNQNTLECSKINTSKNVNYSFVCICCICNLMSNPHEKKNTWRVFGNGLLDVNLDVRRLMQ